MKILFVTLSNLGDVILTLPALDTLRSNFPNARITCLTGPRPRDIFANNPGIYKLVIYDKQASLRDKIKLFNELKSEKFDMVVDFRNSLFGLIIPAKYKTTPFLFVPENIKHMQQRYIFKVLRITRDYLKFPKVQENKILEAGISDERSISNTLKESGIHPKDRIIVLACGAKSHIKRWPQVRFKELISRLVEEFGVKAVLVGDKEDSAITKAIAGEFKDSLVDLAGKTSIRQLACLLNKAECVVTNDSAVLHLAGYLNVPSVAIFGPTDEEKYGPWSEVKAVVKRNIFCRPCNQAQCRYGTLDCLNFIKAEEVLARVRDLLRHEPRYAPPAIREEFKRVLIVRTDRIGDVILSTPVIKVLRDSLPDAYIAMMVSAYAREVLEGNPYLDEIIVYDKDLKQGSWLKPLEFAYRLREKDFDLAVVLHPTNRVHILTFLAGIPKRIGYNRKMGFLLSDKIKHTKEQGEKHEVEYNLDLIKQLDIEAEYQSPFIAVKPESEEWRDRLFIEEGLNKADRLLAIHPGASCPSKIWPHENFAQLADMLADKYGFKIIIIAGPKDIAISKLMTKKLKHPFIDLVGRTSLSHLASILKRCELFVSNDSGPVHIASAVGTPVISIFGRNQKGLSPRRWGPLGTNDKVLHKQVGCIECLAHNCLKSFACLSAITAQDVLKVADSILKDLALKHVVSK